MGKKVLKWSLRLLAIAAAGLGGVVLWAVIAFDRSTSKVYDVPLVETARAEGPAALERGQHLAESLGECVICHGKDLGGGKNEKLGPLGTIIVPNITTGRDGRLGPYTDAELARLIRHGVKRDGHTVRLMPANNFTWWPDEDVAALIAYVRSRPPVDGNPGVVKLGAFAKLLDRIDSIPLDIARRIDHSNLPKAPPPSPDASYGAFVATACRGCHGPTLSGGKIFGAPPDLPVPLNLTPHETGLKGWTYDDFMQVVRTGQHRDGRPLAEFMPVQMIRNLQEVETKALWAYLQSVPARPFGQH